LRLHRIMTCVTSTSVWNCLKKGEDLDEILKDVPDEFYIKIREFKENLQEQFKDKLNQINQEFAVIINQKEFAENVKNSPNRHFLFCRLNTYSDKLNEMVWDSIKPEFCRL